MELTLFGGFQLRNAAGNTEVLSVRKAKALLAWLALHQDKKHPRDRLALLLWEESTDAQARHSLRQALSSLRKALGKHAETLITDQESVLLLSGPIQIDVLRFERLLNDPHSDETLSQAVSLYGGEFLEGFNPRSNSYEEWLMIQRSHYRERAMGAMSALLEHYLESRQLEAGVRLAIQLLSSDPLLEHVHRTLMQLYVQLNRPADALRQYRHCRRLLFRELGLEPEPETVRLYQAVARNRTRLEKETAVTELAPESQHDAEPVNQGTALEDHSPTAPHGGSVQLRPVTVVHLHLSRYLDLATDDPERLHQQTLDLRHKIEQLTRGYGGQLHHRHNETFVILIGATIAHGNECEKALRIAQSLMGDSGVVADNLGIQVGIFSGPAVCDEQGGVSGVVFSQAEQLARGGQPGEIRLAEADYRSLRLTVEAVRCGDDAWQVLNVPAELSLTPSTTPFVGRNRELRQFVAALEACIEDGVGETFLLRGEAGIGKTRLVEEIGRRAEALGVASHRTQILDFGTESQAEPIPSLLRHLLGVEAGATVAEIEMRAKTCLGSTWREPLHHLALHVLFRLPLTGYGSGPLEDMTDTARHAGSQQLLRGILESRSQTQPRLLVVEDIHWADPYTLAHLAELAETVSRCAALLIITSRIEGEPLDPGWRSAMHGAPLTTLDLGPLPSAQALRLAQGMSDGDPAFIHRCVERSGGNPFFLEQLLWNSSTGEERVPDSIQSLLLTRLDMLASGDRLAAYAASVLGQRFRLDSLRHLLQNDGYRPDALLELRLIRPEGEGYLFVHALLRDGIYVSLLSTQRRALHLRASDWYRQRDSALHARHLDLAGDEGAAVAYLHAAQQAIPAFDFALALALASRGAEIFQTPALNAQFNNLRGDLLIQAGAIAEAIRAYQTAADAATDDQMRCRALIGLATGLTVQDALDPALKALDKAVPLALQSSDDALQTELHYRRGDILFALGRVDECLSAHQQAARHAKRTHAPLHEIRAQAGLADAYYACGRMRTAWRHFDRCIELARREQRLPQDVGNLSMRGATRFYTGSAHEAINDQLEAVKLAAEYGNLRAEMIAYVGLAAIFLYTEDIAEAEPAARRGLVLAQQLGATRFFGDNLAAIGEALVLQGKIETGIEHLERAYRWALDSVPTHSAPFILGVLARVTPDASRRAQAIAEGQQLLDQGSLSHNYLHFYQNLIELCLNQKDLKGVLHYAQALEWYTKTEPLPWSDFYIARGRLLARIQQQGVEDEYRQQAKQLLETARTMGLHFGTPELTVLAGC